ncbi:hypothetical protein LJC56_10190 [Christensenellaceae bacterium OttesenSCG-928-K19]|nr:hypothetical protein [Christensenellaceae bacterium OttesenSCG-928-K19]
MIICAVVVVAGLLFFGLMMWKKPERMALELPYDKRLKKYPPEYRENVLKAYLRQMRAVGLGLAMGGVAMGVLFAAIAINPALLPLLSV